MDILGSPFTEKQSRLLSICSRTAASISFVCGTYMVVKTWQHRDRIFHRLMFGLSVQLTLSCLINLWGTAAVPKDTPNIWGARGTVGTCTTQGFLIQISSAFPLYYAFLSLYSFVAVRHKFDIKKFFWIEKWIHFGVNAWPLATASYLLSLEAFNPSGHYTCWINSVPLGCGEASGVICERGPQNIQLIAWFFAAFPAFFTLLFPTFVMTALYILVRGREGRHGIYSKAVARQAAVYLFGVYLTYIFSMINNGIQWIGNHRMFCMALLDVICVNLKGVWVLPVYQFFSVDITQLGDIRDGASHHAEHSLRGTSTESGLSKGDIEDEHPTRPFEESSLAFSESPAGSEVMMKAKMQTSQIERSAFNIFDGTNSSDAFAQYVFEGDSEDEAEDMRESQLWSEVQKHISSG